MDHQFKRLLNLVRRTGDRLVVTDPNGEDTYVLMGLEAYEKLADSLTPPDVDFYDDFNCGDEFDKYDFDDDDDEDEYDEEINDFDPNWKIPEEFYTGIVGANGHSPAPDDLPEPNKSSEPIQSPKQEISSEPEKTTTETPISNIWSVMPPAGDNSQTWNPENFGEAEKKIVEEKFGKTPQSSQTPSGVEELLKVEPQPPQSTPENEENLKKIEENEDLGEEQFYLEPVE